MRTKLIMLLACAVLATGASGQIVGTPLYGLAPEKFSISEVKSMDDFKGRLLLVEYFAYW